MQLFEVIRWGNDSDDPLTGGPNGHDTCFLVRAGTVEEAAALADQRLAALPHEHVASWSGAVYLLGRDTAADGQSQVLRGPYVETAYRHGWRHWYREERDEPWREKDATTIRQLGGTRVLPKHSASCHCGTVKLELDLPDGIVDPRRCDCSMCRRRGTIVASVPLDGLRVVEGAGNLVLYQFNTRTAKHYFCATCGIATHNQRRSNPGQYGYNVACLEGINPLLIADIPVNDGINHPADRHDGGGIGG